MVETKKQASGGQVNADVLTRLNNDINQLSSLLLAVVNSMSFNDYVDGKNFIGQLSQAVTVLKQPDVAKYFNDTYSARSDNVQQLVAYMTQNGLQFAPAVAGEDAAYDALYEALLAYTLQTR